MRPVLISFAFVVFVIYKLFQNPIIDFKIRWLLLVLLIGSLFIHSFFGVIPMVVSVLIYIYLLFQR